jgi:septal ring factor EnvC (AmiA/AmiB activator)
MLAATRKALHQAQKTAADDAAALSASLTEESRRRLELEGHLHSAERERCVLEEARLEDEAAALALKDQLDAMHARAEEIQQQLQQVQVCTVDRRSHVATCIYVLDHVAVNSRCFVVAEAVSRSI